MKNSILNFVLSIAFMMIAVVSFAQPGDPDGDPDCSQTYTLDLPASAQLGSTLVGDVVEVRLHDGCTFSHDIDVVRSFYKAPRTYTANIASFTASGTSLNAGTRSFGISEVMPYAIVLGGTYMTFKLYVDGVLVDTQAVLMYL